MEARRVAHVVRGFGHISETFISDGMEELEHAGWEAWVVATRLADEGRTPSFLPPERVLCGIRPPRRRLLADRMTLRSSATRRSAWIEPRIAAVRPALVHAHFGWAAADARRATKRLGLPLVATFRGSDLCAPLGTRRLRSDYLPLFRQMDRAICISEFLAGKLRALGYRGPVDIVPSGTRLDRFPYRGPPPPVEDELRIVHVGRHVGVKGIDVLVRALPAVLSELPGVRLQLIGDGPDRPALEALASELGLDRAVTFRGAQGYREILRELNRSHLFVMSSRTLPSGQAEGLGNVQKEALAVGVPVVATNCGGIPETIPPEFRHELVQEGDAEELASRMIGVLKDVDGWEDRARAGRAWVEKFDWRILGAQVAAVYSQVLRDRASRHV